MTEKAPVYVKVDEYKDVLDIIGVVKAKLAESKEILKKISEIKSKEDAEIENWQSQIDEIEEKFAYVDKALFEPDSL
ncbi:MAG: hypothetical protein ABH879_01150 [archaeon]